MERIPPDQVIAWVHTDPDERASMVAKLTQQELRERHDTLASRIVGTSAIVTMSRAPSSRNTCPVVGGGPASAHGEQLAEIRLKR